MAPAAVMDYVEEDEIFINYGEREELVSYQKGVRHLQEKGLITKVPNKYILPPSERPNLEEISTTIDPAGFPGCALKLPVIDFSHFHGPDRSQALASLAKACERYGFFQLVNHGIPSDVIGRMVRASREFFELPFEERSKYMTPDMTAPVRYGTSFNQSRDNVFCWRDFLKLSCHSLPGVLPSWPSCPPDLREAGVSYSKKTKFLYLKLMEAILESLGVVDEVTVTDSHHRRGNERLGEFEDGSHLIVANCYPACPEPDLTLGMTPHSDYGFLTLLLQDERVEGLQIFHDGRWVSVEPTPTNSFIVNVGDHLEIFSNGRYKSVLHRVIVNPSSTRISVASLHSLCFESVVRPSPKLVDDKHPRRYKDTSYADFLEFISSREHKGKNFLNSRRI